MCCSPRLLRTVKLRLASVARSPGEIASSLASMVRVCPGSPPGRGAGDVDDDRFARPRAPFARPHGRRFRQMDDRDPLDLDVPDRAGGETPDLGPRDVTGRREPDRFLLV